METFFINFKLWFSLQRNIILVIPSKCRVNNADKKKQKTINYGVQCLFLNNTQRGLTAVAILLKIIIS